MPTWFKPSLPGLLYNGARKWLFISSFIFGPLTLLINAPFGRFSPPDDSIFAVDGIKAWITMEIPAPLTFAYTFWSSPLSYYSPSFPSLASPQGILALLFLVHYINRAILSPLRTPSRANSHLIVPLSAIFFNVINGSLMGSYLSSPIARIFLGPHTFYRPSFYIGIVLWALGFAGNILHDEILFDIRRKANSKGKGREIEDDRDQRSEGNGLDKEDAKPKQKTQRTRQEYYAIPQGWLFDYVSYPNYFCEWIEWFGFALAAAPLPFIASSFSMANISALFTWKTLTGPAYLFSPNLTPPWVFFMAELVLMFPRAYRGHQWYKKKFEDSYPKERKVVVPFLL